ncbi:hypothetical protein EMOOHJMP_00165 [Microcystis phage MaAM05]|nr:hypothetical protein EMOOHJMP_00165 [Microcystis phage MaAM05]
MSELGKTRQYLTMWLVACGLVMALCTPAQAETHSVNWYHWYRDLRDYFSSVGGVLCSPGTELQFSVDGTITAASRDATCLASLEGLHYPLPVNTPLKKLSLAIRKHSAWPLSKRSINELVQQQAEQVQAVAWQKQRMAKAR